MQQRFLIFLFSMLRQVVIITVLLTHVSSPAQADETLRSAKQALQEGQYKWAFGLLHPLAQKNNPEAQLLLVDYYKKRSDIRSAIHWLERASKNNVARADFELGKVYTNPPDDSGHLYDPEKAKKYFEKSAKSGFAEAQFYMAKIYSDNNETKQNWDLIAYWLRLAAEQGYPAALYHYGLLFLEGNGVTQDIIRGVGLIGQAAKKGYTIAEFEYATKVFQGMGVKKDYTIAANWFKIASHKGNVLAQQRLAILYMAGLGVKQNLEEAIVWHLIAKQNHDIQRIIAEASEDTKKFVAKLDKILESFSATKRLELRHISSNFKPYIESENG